MKNKKCPLRKHCYDHKDDNCSGCEIGDEITRLHKRIDRLKKQNEKLTIERNAWYLTAQRLTEDGKWIYTNQNLPTKDGEYLVVIAWSPVATTLYYHTYGKYWSEDMIDDGTHYNVVCWMEKPLAPEGLRFTDTENG